MKLYLPPFPGVSSEFSNNYAEKSTRDILKDIYVTASVIQMTHIILPSNHLKFMSNKIIPGFIPHHVFAVKSTRGILLHIGKVVMSLLV